MMYAIPLEIADAVLLNRLMSCVSDPFFEAYAFLAEDGARQISGNDSDLMSRRVCLFVFSSFLAHIGNCKNTIFL